MVSAPLDWHSNRRPSDLILSRRGISFHGQRFPCVIGKGGVVSNKREGDGGTPVGTHQIVGTLYRADRIAKPAPWAVPIGLRDIWCDDPDHPLYNQMSKVPFTSSHERLRRADPLYDLVLLTDWNWPIPVSGRGSAIFLHRWRRPGYPTEGCIAFRPDHLLRIARAAPPGTRVIVPQRY